jgi:dTDP-4-dehydrorhamnose reductase
MLGSALAKYLATKPFTVHEFNRVGKPVAAGNFVSTLDVTNSTNLDEFLKDDNFDYVINAIGRIKQLINEKDSQEVALAYYLNSTFPALLEKYSKKHSVPIIQIGTDCVYSGSSGLYHENSKFDCSDVYGLSKVDGERESKSAMTLRTSIVGSELDSSNSLMDWFRKLEVNSQIAGYKNHLWNGITTLDFSRIVEGVINSGSFKSGTVHVVPDDQVSKYQLLNEFRYAFQRDDIGIRPLDHQQPINRTLSTLFPERNSELWAQAGYTKPPTVHQMIRNYAEWIKR